MDMLVWALDRYRRELAAGYKLREGSKLLSERRARAEAQLHLATAEKMLRRANIAAAARALRGGA